MKLFKKWLDQTLPGKKVIVIGAGSLGKLTVDCILKNNDYQRNNIAIVDDNSKIEGHSILGIPVIGEIDKSQILNKNKDIEFVVAIANNKIRKKIVKQNLMLKYTKVLSKEAIISPFSKIGKGSIILPGVVVDPDASILDHVIVNKSATIAHDVTLKDFSQVSPGVNFGGFVELGECSFVGLGAVVLPSVKITEDVVIGAGAVVTKNIDITSSTFVGNPAKILKN
ncbi:acetyltransferase [Halalkalibacter alkalisediminis]|uniref:Acetyltransferase n=1 Tax=Halalkalibacter alkalisediminis TaxID=935616 RepID=A0ABV6NJK8_9BACI|nr:acetyltransferase [Halalkalibacter alkalisediminis]